MHNIPRGESQDNLFFFPSIFPLLVCQFFMVGSQQNLKAQEAKGMDVRSQGSFCKEDWAAQEKHLQVTLSVK